MRRGVRSKLGIVAVFALVAGTFAVVGSAPAGATTVADEASLRTAFADASETSIVLTSDILLTNCGTGSVTRASATPITVDGQGQFTITQNCVDVSIFELTGGGGITVQGITLSGGDVAVESDGPVVVTSSHITGQSSPTGAAGGIIPGGAPVTVTDSVVDHITAFNAAIGIGGDEITLTRVAISDLTAGIDGAAYGVLGVNVTMTDSSITRATGGSAIGVLAPANSVALVRTSITGLTATSPDDLAVGVLASTAATLTDSAITDVTGPAAIGVMITNEAVVTVTRSTIARITGTEVALGVFATVPDTAVTVINSTIASVTGPAVSSGGDATIVYSTISNSGSNVVPTSLSIAVPAGGPVVLVDPPPYQAQVLVSDALVMFGSVIVQNAVGGPNCDAGSTSSAGYNFADDTSCGLTGTGDQQGAGLDALLGALADNGGPGPTRLPQAGSPLLDAIPNEACQTGPAAGITTDERSLPRPAIGGCDIGAVEVQPVLPRFTG